MSASSFGDGAAHGFTLSFGDLGGGGGDELPLDGGGGGGALGKAAAAKAAAIERNRKRRSVATADAAAGRSDGDGGDGGPPPDLADTRGIGSGSDFRKGGAGGHHSGDFSDDSPPAAMAPKQSSGSLLLSVNYGSSAAFARNSSFERHPSTLSGAHSHSTRSAKTITAAKRRAVIRAMDEEGKLAVDGEAAAQQLSELPNALYLFDGSNPFRVMCIQTIQNWWFQQFVLCCILFNAVLLGVDQPGVSWSSGVNEFLRVADFVFTAVFTLESIIKMIALGLVLHEGAYLRNGWGVLDAIIVISSIINIALSESGVDGSNISALRVVRVLRPLRSVSRIPELRILIQSLLRALPQVADNILLFFFLLVIFAMSGLQIWPGKLSQVCWAVFNESSPLYSNASSSNNSMSSSNLTQIYPRRRCGGTFTCRPDSAPPNIDPAFGVQCQEHEDLFMPRFLNFNNIAVSALYVFKLMVLDNWTDDFNNLMDAVGAEAVIYVICVVMFGFYCACNLFFAVLSNAYSSAQEAGGVNVNDVVLDAEFKDAQTWIDVTAMEPLIVMQTEQQRRERERREAGQQRPCCTRGGCCCCCCEVVEGDGDAEMPQLESPPSFAPDAQRAGAVAAAATERRPRRWRKGRGAAAGSGQSTPSQPASVNDLPALEQAEKNKTSANDAAVDGAFADEDLPPLTLVSDISADAIERSDAAFGAVDNIPLDLTVAELVEWVANVTASQRAEFERLRTETEEEQAAAAGLFLMPLSFRTGPEDDRAYCRCVLGWLVSHRLTELFMLSVTLLNTVALALDHHDIDPAFQFRLDIISAVCTGFFTIEIVLKIVAFSPSTLLQPFNLLDFIIVLESLIQYMISGTIQTSGLAALRVLRTLRVLKLLTMFTSLQLIVQGVLQSMSAIGYLSLLILLHLFVFAVMGMQIFGTEYQARNENEELGFGTTFESFLLAFVVLTGDSWTDRMRAGMAALDPSLQWVAVVFFVLLFFIGNFVLVNLMVAIILDHMQQLMDTIAEGKGEKFAPVLVLPPGFVIPQPRSFVPKFLKKSVWSALSVRKVGLEGAEVQLRATDGFNLVEVGDGSGRMSALPPMTADNSLALSGSESGSGNKSPHAPQSPTSVTGAASAAAAVNPLSSAAAAAAQEPQQQQEQDDSGRNMGEIGQLVEISSSGSKEAPTSNEVSNENNFADVLPSQAQNGGGALPAVARVSICEQPVVDGAENNFHESQNNNDVRRPSRPVTQLQNYPFTRPGTSLDGPDSAKMKTKQNLASLNAATRIDDFDVTDTEFYDRMALTWWERARYFFAMLLELERFKASAEPSLYVFELDSRVRQACLFLHALPLYHLFVFLAVVVNVVFLFLENPYISAELLDAINIIDVIVAVVFGIDLVTKIIAFGFLWPDAFDVATEGQRGGDGDAPEETDMDVFARLKIESEIAAMQLRRRQEHPEDAELQIGPEAEERERLAQEARDQKMKELEERAHMRAAQQEHAAAMAVMRGEEGHHLGVSSPSSAAFRAQHGASAPNESGATLISQTSTAAPPLFSTNASQADALSADQRASSFARANNDDEALERHSSSSAARRRSSVSGSHLIGDGGAHSAAEIFGGTFAAAAVGPAASPQALEDQLPPTPLDQNGDQSIGAFLRDPWNVVDGIVTVVSLVDIAGVEDAKFLKALRTFRLLSRLDGARIILEAIFASLPMVLNGLMLTMLAFVMFGVLGVQLFKGTLYRCSDPNVTTQANCTGRFNGTAEDLATGLEVPDFGVPRVWERTRYHFDDFPNALLSLFVVVAGDSWSNLMYNAMSIVGVGEAMRKGAAPENALFFVAAYVVGNIFCLNMIVGILLNFFQKMKDVQDGSAFLSERQRKFLRARASIEQTWMPVDEDVLTPLDNCASQGMHRVLTFMWFEARQALCGSPEENEEQRLMAARSASSIERLKRSQQQQQPGEAVDPFAHFSEQHSQEMMGGHHPPPPAVEASPSPNKNNNNNSGGGGSSRRRISDGGADANFVGELEALERAAPPGSGEAILQAERAAAAAAAAAAGEAAPQGEDLGDRESENGSEPGQRRSATTAHIETTIAQTFFYLVILLNLIVNAIEYYRMDGTLRQTLSNIEIACLSLFVVEWVMKVVAYGHQLVTASWTVIGWFVFDSVVILFGFAALNNSELSFLSFLRALRLMKLLRGSGVEKLLLMLVRSFRQIVNVFVVLVLTYFIFACAGVALFAKVDHNPNSFMLNENRNFKQVPLAMLLLFQASTTDGWGDFAADLSDRRFCNATKDGSCVSPSLTNGFFIVFMCCVTWIGLQMFIAILIESFDNFRAEAEEAESEPLQQAFLDLRKRYDAAFGPGAPDVSVFTFVEHMHELPQPLTLFTSMDPTPLERLKLLGTLPIPVRSDLTVSFRDIVLAFAFKHFQIDARSSTDFLTDVVRGAAFGACFSAFQAHAVSIITAEWRRRKNVTRAAVRERRRSLIAEHDKEGVFGALQESAMGSGVFE